MGWVRSPPPPSPPCPPPTLQAAQKECSELYLLILLHARPHVSPALVESIDEAGGSMEVFVPAYQLRGRVRLRDRQGHVRLPLQEGEEEVGV